MRNRWLLTFGGIGLVAGIILVLITGAIAAVYLALIGILLLVAGFLVGPRYRAELSEPPAGYVWTGERFVDPTSNRTVDVWQHPASGQRAYVLAKDGNDPERGS
jgi:xanthosine utilization system XapX-like protein